MVQKARSKTIKVSEREWELLQKARKEIERKGYSGLEEDLEDYIDEDEEREEDDFGKFVAGLALGAVAAVGAAALIKMLSDKEK